MEKLKLTRQESLGIGQTSIEYDPRVLVDLKKQIEAKRILVVGETHGIVENYQAYQFLIIKFGITNVGIELPENQFGFLKNLGNANSMNDPLIMLKLRSIAHQDGRINTTLITFLEFLKRCQANIFFIDNPIYKFQTKEEAEEATKAREEYNKQQRDRAMADGVIKNTSNGQKTLIIAGSHHTKIARDGSMSNFLQLDSIPTVPMTFIYSSGSYFNFGKKNIFSNEDSNKKPKSQNFELLQPEPYSFVIQIPKANPVDINFDNPSNS